MTTIVIRKSSVQCTQNLTQNILFNCHHIHCLCDILGHFVTFGKLCVWKFVQFFCSAHLCALVHSCAFIHFVCTHSHHPLCQTQQQEVGATVGQQKQLVTTTKQGQQHWQWQQQPTQTTPTEDTCQATLHWLGGCPCQEHSLASQTNCRVEWHTLVHRHWLQWMFSDHRAFQHMLTQSSNKPNQQAKIVALCAPTQSKWLFVHKQFFCRTWTEAMHSLNAFSPGARTTTNQEVMMKFQTNNRNSLDWFTIAQFHCNELQMENFTSDCQTFHPPSKTKNIKIWTSILCCPVRVCFPIKVKSWFRRSMHLKNSNDFNFQAACCETDSVSASQRSVVRVNGKDATKCISVHLDAFIGHVNWTNLKNKEPQWVCNDEEHSHCESKASCMQSHTPEHKLRKAVVVKTHNQHMQNVENSKCMQLSTSTVQLWMALGQFFIVSLHQWQRPTASLHLLHGQVIISLMTLLCFQVMLLWFYSNCQDSAKWWGFVCNLMLVPTLFEGDDRCEMLWVGLCLTFLRCVDFDSLFFWERRRKNCHIARYVSRRPTL